MIIIKLQLAFNSLLLSVISLVSDPMIRRWSPMIFIHLLDFEFLVHTLSLLDLSFQFPSLTPASLTTSRVW